MPSEVKFVCSCYCKHVVGFLPLVVGRADINKDSGFKAKQFRLPVTRNNARLIE